MENFKQIKAFLKEHGDSISGDIEAKDFEGNIITNTRVNGQGY